MKLFSLMIATFALLSGQAFAGASNIELSCKAADGTTLKGQVPGDLYEIQVTIQQNGKSASLSRGTNQQDGSPEGNAEDPVAVQDLQNGVYTLYVSRAGDNFGFLQIYALPKTVAYKSVKNGYSASFTAKVSYNLNEVNTDTQSKTMKCTANYSI